MVPLGILGISAVIVTGYVVYHGKKSPESRRGGLICLSCIAGIAILMAAGMYWPPT